MKITETLITGSGSAKISTNYKKLLIVASFGSATAPADAAAALAACRATTFELERTSATGTETTIREGSLLGYLEVCSNLSHGPVRVVTTGNVTVIRGSVIVGYDGDIEPQANEVYTLRIKGLPADATVQVNSLEDKQAAQLRYVFDFSNVPASTPTPVELRGAHLLSIPKAGLKMLELEDADRIKIQLLPEDLEQYLSELNSQAFNVNGAITPVGFDFYTIPVAKQVKGIVTSTTQENLIVVKVKPV